MDHILLLSAAGLIAGAMNALAGGGSFISLPALIAVGVPSVQANASSTVALFPGGLAGAWAYRDGLGPVGSVALRPLVIATLIGGLIGSLLLLWTSTTLFNFVLPWLLLVASLTLAFGRRLGEFLRRHWQIRPAAVLAIQFGLGVYGGYFGGAVGIMMMAVWSLLDNRDLKSLNAPRTLTVSVANAIAVLIFILADAVHWRETIVMLLAAIVGGYGGAQIGRRAPARVVRAGTLFLTACITAVFFIRAYFPALSWH
ncbi:MAG TPA: sulfite exporter TauE/SafE family protein [Herbaspirillum sp.]